MIAARWLTFDQWRARQSARPALFVDARVTPEAGCASRLIAAIGRPGVAAATSYFYREDGSGQPSVIAPLGGSLEAGWRENAFGGPCFAAHPSAFATLAAATVHGAFAFWPAYVAMTCGGMSLAIVPSPLYAVTADALQVGGHTELESVFHQFHARVPPALDLGWLLKSAFASIGESHGPGPDAGRALYDRFIGMPDDLIRAYAGLAQETGDNPLLRDFAAVRERLIAVVARWRETEPRVFVYGTGQHARMMLMICPELGQFVAGFIDRRPRTQFLGKPCVTPADVDAGMADAIVYSSREFEHDMYTRMQHLRIEHVLLYRESPPAPDATTIARLRNRFGHRGADVDALWTMYQPPSWATGYVSFCDATFLVEMIAAHQPRTVVELGVASGASSAALLHGLDQLPEPAGRELYSCDIRAACYFDEKYETGQACREMYPAPRATWHREWAMDGRRLRTILPAGSVDLTFIDANHAHPWPLFDLLQVTAFAKPGSWVVLHDVDFPIHHPQQPGWGPRCLYRAWPFNKVKGFGTWTSIAAVQLPADPADLVPMALSLIDKPWEMPMQSRISLPAAFDEVEAALDERLNRATVLVAK
jgi:hypothetical protein